MAPRRPLAAHVDPVQAPTRTWHVGAAPGRDGALFGAWKSKPEVHPRRVRSAPCRYPGIVAGLARRPARSTSSVGNSFWCGRFTRPKSPSGTGSVGDRWGHWDHSCGTATLGPPMPPSGQRRKRIQRSPTPSSPRSSPRRASSGLFSSLSRRWHVTHPRRTARYWSLGHVLGHKWTSRLSVITHLNRGRSSQSLDVQEPEDGARDDATDDGIVRRRFDGVKQAYPKSIQI